MERQKFEDSFREAFQQAEVSPSDNVWTNIELDLERLESGRMKRRLLFFKTLAAASVIFAMVVAGIGIYVSNPEGAGNEHLAEHNTLQDHAAGAGPQSPESENSAAAEGPVQNSMQAAGEEAAANEHDPGVAASGPAAHAAPRIAGRYSTPLPRNGQTSDENKTRSSGAVTAKERPASVPPQTAPAEAAMKKDPAAGTAHTAGTENHARGNDHPQAENPASPANPDHIASAHEENDVQQAATIAKAGATGSSAPSATSPPAALPAGEGAKRIASSGQTDPFDKTGNRVTGNAGHEASAPAGGNDEPQIAENTSETGAYGRQVAVSPVKDDTQPDHENAVLISEENRLAALQERSLPPLVHAARLKPAIPQTGLNRVDLLLIELAALENEEREKEKNKTREERMWTSVGFSAGSFSSVNTAAAPTATLDANTLTNVSNYGAASNTLSNETSASGIAYSVGISFGGRLSDRWVLQGGVNYLAQSADYTSDAVVTGDFQKFNVPSSSQLKTADGEALLSTASYSVNNSLRFVSIPVQAGYMVINRSFGLQVNGGVSTDLFIQNTVTPERGTLNKVTNGRGDDSPYRPLNFSALVGTEFSYRFSDRYRLSLNPGIRYPLSSIYKSDTGLESTPVTFDVGLRFRYIFK